jgi:hypothetical protein
LPLLLGACQGCPVRANEREFLVKELMERYESIIKENEVVLEIMEGVCYSPLPSRKE